MRAWIERLSRFVSEPPTTLALEASQIAAFADLANAAKHKIEERGMKVDWAQYEALQHIVSCPETLISGLDITKQDADTMIALFRKLIGVLSFAILWFGDTDADGKVIYEAAPKRLWDVPN